jgi:hypothetical protein
VSYPGPRIAGAEDSYVVRFRLMTGVERVLQLTAGAWEAWRAAIDGRVVRGPVAVPTFADGVANTQVLDAIHWSAANAGALATVLQG